MGDWKMVTQNMLNSLLAAAMLADSDGDSDYYDELIDEYNRLTEELNDGRGIESDFESLVDAANS
jgi:hypothetical protein